MFLYPVIEMLPFCTDIKAYKTQILSVKCTVFISIPLKHTGVEG